MQYTIPVIDSHFHVYNWFTQGGGTFADKTDAYRAARNFRAVNINALPSGSRDVSNNIMCALYKAAHPDVYIHGGLVYPEYPVPERLPDGMDCETQYRELMEIGFDGIKMLETKPDLYKLIARPVNDALYEPFYAQAERDGTHLVWHVADPETFWDDAYATPELIARGWFYADGTYAAKEQIYRDVFDVLDRHPRLQVTFAHFFFMSFQPDRLAQVFEKYPGVNVDLTPGTEMYTAFTQNKEYYRAFFTRYADRIEFGTDTSDHSTDLTALPDFVYGFLTTPDTLTVHGRAAEGLALSGDTVRPILSENFVRRVGGTPKSMDRAALKRYILKYRHLIRDAKVAGEIGKAAATD